MKFKTLAFDINQSRVSELSKDVDPTLECSSEELSKLSLLSYSSLNEDLKQCVLVTMTMLAKQPDLLPLIRDGKMLGKVISNGDNIYEPTTYPGEAAEDCIPVEEQVSGLVFNENFLQDIARAN